MADFSNMSDEGLYTEFQLSGSKAAFEELHTRYQKQMHQFAYNFVGERLAADIVQEVYLSLFQKQPRIHSSFRSLLRKAVYNRCLDEIKTNKRHVAFNTPAADVPIDEIDALKQAIQAEAADNIREKFNTMPDDYRQVIQLHYFETCLSRTSLSSSTSRRTMSPCGIVERNVGSGIAFLAEDQPNEPGTRRRRSVARSDVTVA